MLTQKAKGIDALKQHKDQLIFGGEMSMPNFVILTCAADFQKYAVQLQAMFGASSNKKLFARPCPEFPRHGFVDSRPVSNVKEIEEVFFEARKVDPKAELVVMPFIPAAFNSIWTPGNLTIGPGNDGATSGKNCVTLRTTAKKLPFQAGSSLVAASGIKAEDVPYFEFVKDSSNWNVVQMRGGPDISDCGDDYLPGKTECKHIVLAEGDLLEWEEKAKTFKPGTIVWHPGGALSTHYGVHSKLNDVPCFTVREPKVGDVYEICQCNPRPQSKSDWCPKCDGYLGRFSELDVDEALKGMSLAVAFDISHKEAVQVVLGALHNSAFFGTKESRVLGAAVILCLKLGMAASFGEARYKKHIVIESSEKAPIYDAVWKNMPAAVKKFNEARATFYEGGWSKSFGGKAWANCADATAELWNLTVGFVRDKRLDDLKKVVESLNKVVNQAHNNGWWFNKFISPLWFDIGVASPASPLICTGHHIYRMLKAEVKVDGFIADIEKMVDKSGGPDRLERLYKGHNFVVVHEPTGWSWNNVVYPSLTAVATVIVHSVGKRKRCNGPKFFRQGKHIHKKSKLVKHIAGSGKADEWILPAIDTTAIKASEKNKQAAEQAALLEQQKKLAELNKPAPVANATGLPRDGVLHVQFNFAKPEKPYGKTDVKLTDALAEAAHKLLKTAPTPSMAGTGTTYAKLAVKADGIYCGAIKVVPLNNYFLK